MLMTRNRAPLTGALALNIPTLYWATQLPASTVLLVALTLAAVGAGLGALAAFGFTRPPVEGRPIAHLRVRGLDRRAA